MAVREKISEKNSGLPKFAPLAHALRSDQKLFPWGLIDTGFTMTSGSYNVCVNPGPKDCLINPHCHPCQPLLRGVDPGQDPISKDPQMTSLSSTPSTMCRLWQNW